MATSRDVQNNIATLIDAVIYPNGHAQPSITNTLVKISVGWPISEQLDIDLANGNSQISIFTYGKSGKNTTRFQRIWHTVSVDLATIEIDIVGNQITLSGTPVDTQAVVVVLNGEPFGYAIQTGDTLTTIALEVAALLPDAVALGTIITINGELLELEARIARSAEITQEIKRQKELFGVSIFSASPLDRDILGDAVDVELARVVRLFFPDTTQALIWWKNREEIDKFEKNISYGRILIYSVEYPTMIYDLTRTAEAFDVNLITNEDPNNE
jgi:hypothetical protein